ncbi:MAG: YgeY family selenium metabolism-linked hydrolase [Mesotoga sp.]|nr:YgeY family selenium metabolism-linked hydrolase [Mesotoga sp.]MDD2334277.1 YgeY family selenium metabolism-linked hydrolase [Mesotoga sp.]MDD3682015.1 YgeY family selenium metabolism-linked hydrolase [Mesotoga sp.]MDD4207496.1 YgeY family selenium metabolism-linked hydrolase [Mesotoga sp.]MDD4826609.1 YgeY family selenium metabolism-linked hydrolase [Mesotoga sp.]MDD5683324.1 YgeY family selenium metabolism-linked hydrolase [Mesotoga sp.]
MSRDLLTKAESYREELTEFLRDLVSIKSFSAGEREVVQRIQKEMEKVGFDEVRIDGLGNILGRIGSGKNVIAMDAHIDTVEVGNEKLWKVDPFGGVVSDGVIYGRGASDQKAGMAAMVYGARIMKEEGLLGDFTLYVTGTVMEEDCDGLCWRYIIKEDGIIPDYVVITEPTNLNIYRGHRGRMELQVRTSGLSCHASAPERGINAIYKMSRIISEIERLNERLTDDPFLGKGTIAVTQIFFKSPSQNAVADECTIQIDRRLTAGETKETVIRELQEAVQMAGEEAEIVELFYERPSYTGTIYPVEKYFPTWVMEEDSEIVRKTVNTYREVFGEEPFVDKWTFSTNGIATAGVFSIPTIGFGPANEIFAHSPDDQCPVDHLVRAAAMYALLPLRLSQ